MSAWSHLRARRTQTVPSMIGLARGLPMDWHAVRGQEFGAFLWTVPLTMLAIGACAALIMDAEPILFG